MNSNNDGIKHRNHEWINVMGLQTPTNRASDSAETQRRMEEIMRQTGVLKFNGKVIHTKKQTKIVVFNFCFIIDILKFFRSIKLILTI